MCFLLFLSFSLDYAQAQPSSALPKYDIPAAFSVPSPNAASLGKYGFTQVAYYTGTPQVSIPLWEAKGSQLSVPIALNYNNNGLKVTEDASWVGLGWSLQAGGVITQNVRGVADNMGGPPWPWYSYTELMASTNNQQRLNWVAQSYYDGSPDFFIFNFGSYSGKFFFYNNIVYQFSYSDLKISYDAQAKTFTIITGDGTTYRFTKREQTIVHPYNNVPAGPGTRDSYSFSWLLTEIVSADQQDTITLTYATTPENIHDPVGQRVSHSWQGTIDIQTSDVECAFGTGYGYSTYSQSVSQSTTTSYRLEQIDTQRERIEFVPESGSRQDINGTAYALHQIQVYDKASGNTTPIRSFVLQTSYFSKGAQANQPRYSRLRLDEIVELGPSRASKPSHVFSYYNQDDDFPDKDGYDLDHWGYFNRSYSAAANTSLIPTTAHYISQFPANRLPNMSSALYGVLKQITYPTSGAENFVYEQNTFNNGSSIQTGPGLRIKTVVTKAANGKLAYRSFRYTPNVNTWILPDYEQIMTANPGTRCDCRVATVTGGNPDIFSIFGSTVYYNTVEELAGLSGENGKTVYTYGVIGGERWSNGMNLLKKVIKTADGKTVQEEEYTFDGVGDLTIPIILHTKSIKNEYSTGADYSMIGAVECSYDGCIKTAENCGGGSIPLLCHVLDHRLPFYLSTYLPTYETLNAAWNYPTGKIMRHYAADNTQVYTETSAYFYEASTLPLTDPAYHRYMTREEKTINQGQTQITAFRYPQDYVTSSPPSQDMSYNALRRMRDLHMVNQLVEVLSSLRSGNNTTVLGGQLTLFKEFFPGIIKPASLLGLETTTPLTNSSFSSTVGSALTWDTHYVPRVQMNYNAAGQLTAWRKNQLQYAAIWDNVSNLLAKVQNAAPGAAAFTSFEPNAPGGWAYDTGTTPSSHRQQDNSRTGQWVYRLDTTWGVNCAVAAADDYDLSFWAKSDQFVLYVNAGSSTPYIKKQAVVATGPNGWQQYRLRLHLPANCSLNLDAQSTAVPVTIDELRLHPATAQMTSYTHDPLIGITSQTDPSGRLSSYSYDLLGRLGSVHNEKGQTLTQLDYIYAR